MTDNHKPESLADIRRRIAEKHAPDLDTITAEGVRLRADFDKVKAAYVARPDLLAQVASLDPDLADKLRRNIAITEEWHRDTDDRRTQRATELIHIAADYSNALNEVPAIARHEVASNAATKQHTELRQITTMYREQRHAEHRALAQGKAPLTPRKEFAYRMHLAHPNLWTHERSAYELVSKFDRAFRNT